MSRNMELVHQAYFNALHMVKEDLLKTQLAPYMVNNIHQIFAQFENTNNPCYIDAVDASNMLAVTRNNGQLLPHFANAIKDIIVVYIASEYSKLQLDIKPYYPESIINGEGLLTEVIDYRRRVAPPPQNTYNTYQTQPRVMPPYTPGITPTPYQGGQAYQYDRQVPQPQTKNVMTTAIEEMPMNRNDHVTPPQVSAMAFNPDRYMGVPVTQHTEYGTLPVQQVHPLHVVEDIPEPDVDIKILDDTTYFDADTDDGFITAHVNDLSVPVDLLDYLTSKKIVKTATVFNGTETHYVKCPKVDLLDDMAISVTYYIDKVFNESVDLLEIIDGITTLKQDFGFTHLASWMDVKLTKFIRLLLKSRYGLDSALPDFSLVEDWDVVSAELKRINALDVVASSTVALVNKLFKKTEWVVMEDKPNTSLLRITVLTDVLVVGDDLVYDHHEKSLKRKADKTSKNLNRVFSKVFNMCLKETDYYFDIYDTTSIVYRVYRNSVQFSDSHYTVEVISP